MGKSEKGMIKEAVPSPASKNKIIIPTTSELPLTLETESLKGSSLMWARCRQELEKVKEMPESQWFLRPVDGRALKLPLYPNIIKNPIDLSMICLKV